MQKNVAPESTQPAPQTVDLASLMEQGQDALDALRNILKIFKNTILQNEAKIRELQGMTGAGVGGLEAAMTPTVQRAKGAPIPPKKGKHGPR